MGRISAKAALRLRDGGAEQSQGAAEAGGATRQRSGQLFRLPEGRTRSLAKEASHTLYEREPSEQEVTDGGGESV